MAHTTITKGFAAAATAKTKDNYESSPFEDPVKSSPCTCRPDTGVRCPLHHKQVSKSNPWCVNECRLRVGGREDRTSEELKAAFYSALAFSEAQKLRMSRPKVKLQQMSDLTGIPKSYLSELKRRSQTVTRMTATRVAKAIGGMPEDYMMVSGCQLVDMIRQFIGRQKRQK